MADVTMSLEEYLALIGDTTKGTMVWTESASRSPRAPKKTLRRKGKKDPKMARALRKANEMGRKKSGGYKKGWSQGKIMSKAHQLRRKSGGFKKGWSQGKIMKKANQLRRKM